MSNTAKSTNGLPEEAPQFVGKQESAPNPAVGTAREGFGDELKNIFAHLGTARPKSAPQKINLETSVHALQPLEVNGFRISFDEKAMRLDAAIIGAGSVMPLVRIDDMEDPVQYIIAQVAGIEDTLVLRETLAQMAQDPAKAGTLEQLFSDFMPGNFNKNVRDGSYAKEILLQIIAEAKRRKGVK